MMVEILLSLSLIEFSAGTDEMADTTRQLVENMDNYIQYNFNGDYIEGLKSFDTNNDEVLDEDELWYALEKINIGSYMTRKLWVNGIIEYFNRTNSILVNDLLELR